MRRVLQFALVMVLTPVLCAQASAADKAAKGKGVVGVVQSVDKDSITVKIIAKKKGSGSDTPAEEKTFKISTDTKVATVTKVKGQKTPDTKDGTFDDIKVGQRVRITDDNGNAQNISILPQGKKKKNN